MVSRQAPAHTEPTAPLQVEEPDLQPRRRWRVAPWIYGLALVFWASSWNLRLSVLMAWLPVEPVWLGTAAVVLCVVHRLGQPLRVHGAVAGLILLLAVACVPGAVRSGAEGYAPDKLASMVLVLLPMFCAATLLLDSPAARRGWLLAQVLVGVAVGVAALLQDAESIFEPGRFSLGTVDTISSARMVGVAFVVLLLLGFGSLRRIWWALPLALGCAVLLARIGSRGPVLAAVVAVLVVVLVSRCFAGRRIVLLLAVIMTGAGGLFLLRTAGGSGGRRILDSLQTGFADGVRAQLLDDAFRIGTTHPMGIGWGGFAQESRIGRELANDSGVTYAHNLVAEVFSEGGVIALLALVLVVVVALWRLQRLTQDPLEAVVLGTVLYWVFNAQVSGDVVGNRFMWIALACGLAAYLPRKSRDSRFMGRSASAPRR